MPALSFHDTHSSILESNVSEHNSPNRLTHQAQTIRASLSAANVS